MKLEDRLFRKQRYRMKDLTSLSMAMAITLLFTLSTALVATETADTKPQEQRLASRIDGLELALWHLPSKTAKATTSKVVLILHPASFSTMTGAGYRIQGTSWMDDLSAAGYDVWGLDLLGYGAADPYPEMAEPTEAHQPLGRAVEVIEDVQLAIDHIRRETGVEKLSLIGQSWGATVAGLYAGRTPDALERLVLFAAFGQRENPTPSPQPKGAYVEMTPERRLALFQRQVPDGEAPALTDGVLRDWGAAWLAEDQTASNREPAAVRQPGGWRLDLDDAWHGRHYLNPSQITVPTLVLRGEWDTVSNFDDARWIFEGLATPIKRLVVIGRGTHVLSLEKQRHQLYEEVRLFLAGSPSDKKKN